MWFMSQMSHDPILAQALDRLAAAQSEVSRWEGFLRAYDELRGNRPRVDSVIVQAKVASRHKSTSATGALSESAEAAAAYIQKIGRPVSTRDLVQVLTAQGVSVGGKDEIATLSARLSRSDLLRNIRGQGWELAEPVSEIPMRDGTVGDLLGGNPTAPVSTPNSADEDGREVEHEKIDLSRF